MDIVDKLYDLYNDHFDRLAADFGRLNREKSDRGPGPDGDRHSGLMPIKTGRTPES